MRRITFKYCAIASVLLTIVAPLPASAQSSAEAPAQLGYTFPRVQPPCFEHPLDSALWNCIAAANEGTWAETECLEAFAERWDNELNRIYQATLQEASPELREQLRASQRLWVKMKEEEYKLIEVRYRNLDGTMFEKMAARDKLRFTRDRCLELLWYYVEDEED